MSTVLDLADMNRSGLDVVKCDIEGAEEELFADCSESIRGVSWLVVECHAPYTAERLVRDLEVNGGRFQRVHMEWFEAIGAQTITLHQPSAN